MIVGGYRCGHELTNIAGKAQIAAKGANQTPGTKPRLSVEVSNDNTHVKEHRARDGPTAGPGSQRTVTVDFFDAQASGRFAGNPQWIRIVKERLHKLVKGTSKGKVTVTGVQYDKRFLQQRRVTLSYEGSKAVAIVVLNDKVWKVHG